MTVVVQFAMAGEAAPLLARGRYHALPPEPAYGFTVHEGHTALGDALVVAIADAHPRFGVDRVGTVPAALLAHLLIERHAPAALISAGTAGGFRARGGAVGDLFLGVDHVVFHDRRIPMPGFEAMGPGHFPVAGDRALASALGVRPGLVSSGDSLDCTPEDLRLLVALGADAKEMEAAAIGWVCEHRGVPLYLLKSITDLVDDPADTATQFLANHDLAVGRLAPVLEQLVARLR